MKKTASQQFFWLLFWAVHAPIFAQQNPPDTLITNELKSVTVTAYRLETPELSTPLSMTRIGERQLQVGTQQLALDEALVNVPGVFVQNGTNFAQDIRVSIRGFGARSAFGIRGVKILVDGFPESTPDGTAQVDALDPGSLTGISVIRSGTGGLYGNSSGGSINFSTMRFQDKEWAEAGLTIGQYGFQKYQFRTGGGKGNKFQYSINGAYTKTDGYRNHSAMKNYLLNGGFLLPIDSSLTIRGVVTYVNSPLAQDPGALTQVQVEEDRTAARTTNLNFDTGESLWQLRLGVGISKKLNEKHSLNGSIYHTERSFLGKIPFDYIELDRLFTGGSFSYGFQSRSGETTWEMTAGVDLENQVDDRKRYENDAGERGEQYVNQLETFSSVGIFWVQKIGFGQRFAILPALRFDHNFIDIEDRYLLDMNNDSFQQNYKSFNPTIGFSYLAAENLHFYLNAGSNFETPTIQEITTIDAFGTFFNNSLKPQKSKSLELGTKILSADGKMRTEIALFRIWLKDEFVVFQGIEGGTWHENIGMSARNGLELSLNRQLSRHFLVGINYTFSDFKYLEPADVADKVTPGIPKHQGGFELQYIQPTGFNFTVGNQYVSAIFTNNSNETKSDAYLLGYARATWKWVKPKFGTDIFFGINNFYNQKYNANIRINGGSNFFEPAPPRNFYAGLKFKF